MDPANNKNNEMERRISTRNSVRISINGGGDDDLEYAAGLISDGFRPMQMPMIQSDSMADSASGTSSLAAPSSTSTLASESPDQQLRLPISRPSSTSKPHRPHESLSLQHDGGMGSIDESSSGLTRTSSISTDSAAYMHAESPYQGPDGPSHPYQMYPQDVRLARTMSTTTSSTVPVSEQSYVGPRGPAHPYGLYTQGTGMEPSNLAPAPIPLGFHGLPDQYHRRIGPEGEDVADIIGPDGHTEQLPPYTRYPDEAYAQKVRDAEENTGARIVPAALVVPTQEAAAIPGAGGLGLATRNPEFESTDDFGSPRSRQSARSFASDMSHHDINTAAAGVSEKRRPSKKWQLWMKRRLWGIVPYWAILMLGVVVVLMGVILGSVIGAFLSKHKKPPRKDFPDSNLMPTATATPDATPIPTPSDLPTIPTGVFSLPFLASQVSSRCLNDPSQSQAWGCYFVIPGMSMTIARNTNPRDSEYSVSINCNRSLTLRENAYSYGEQPPLVENPVSLELVNDTFEPNRGPAWFKMLPYEKTVILPQDKLSPTSGSIAVSKDRIRRLGRSYNAGSGGVGRKGILEPGTKPWVCTWPDTYLELFIYVQQNSSFANYAPKSSYGPASTSSTTTSSSTSTSASASTPSTPTIPTTPPTSSLPLPVDIASSLSRSPTVPFGGFPTNTQPPPRDHFLGTGAQGYNKRERDRDRERDRSPPSTDKGSSPSPSSPFGPIDTGEAFAPPLPPYPRVIKLEERRMPGAPVAQCTQVEIQSKGEKAKPLLDANGKPITITIVEREPTPPTKPSDASLDVSKRHYKSPIFQREGEIDSQCYCVWMST
ncbi:hypothetical protein B0H63DRAFT_201777 [Podospora didyma]|uniref:DUF7820 domain-containing protein n=1 Tax=Podospora didyma TaxID=330526 RepID=A0AAE0TVQ6_9PEZI|nr:hypothetical protein B0H63DRAFT_201777 [Podospora didyma]